ncbi:MAG: hypothetical protein JWM97_722 [Phycisphaerales bacterium]|nr:hypothetical protein [Phycisphaerales bacterium]
MVLRDGRVGHQTNRVAQGVGGLVLLAGVFQGEAEVAVGGAVVGPEGDGPPKVLYGGHGVARLGERGAQFVMGGGAVFDPGPAAKRFQRLGRAAVTEQQLAEHAVGVGRSGVERDRFAQMKDGAPGVSRAVACHGKIDVDRGGPGGELRGARKQLGRGLVFAEAQGDPTQSVGGGDAAGIFAENLGVRFAGCLKVPGAKLLLGGLEQLPDVFGHRHGRASRRGAEWPLLV